MEPDPFFVTAPVNSGSGKYSHAMLIRKLKLTCYLCWNSVVLQVEVLRSILFVFYHSFHVLSYSDLKIFTFGASLMLFGSLFQCSTTVPGY